MQQHRLAVRPGHGRAHRLGIFRAEIEDMPDLDAARRDALVFRNRLEGGLVVHLLGRGVEARPLVEDALQSGDAVEIGVRRRRLEIQVVAVAEDLALAGRGEHDEFMRKVAADRAGIGLHRNRLEAEPREGAQIGREHAVIGVARRVLVQIEGIGVLHQELAAAHHAEARADLVPELPLDMVEVERQILVGLDVGADDLGDHLFVGRPVEHLAVVPVLDAQHLLAIGIVAPALAPEIGRLDRRHQDLDGAGAILFLADHRADLVEHAQAERQPGIDAGRLLADHARTQHQPVGDDLGLLGRIAQKGQEVAGETHRETCRRAVREQPRRKLRNESLDLRDTIALGKLQTKMSRKRRKMAKLCAFRRGPVSAGRNAP